MNLLFVSFEYLDQHGGEKFINNEVLEWTEIKDRSDIAALQHHIMKEHNFLWCTIINFRRME